MFSQLVNALWPNEPAHIITYENTFCQRARYIDMRLVQNPQTELFQYWLTELPSELPMPFQHGLEFNGETANNSREKKNHKNWMHNPFITIEVDELMYKSVFQGQELNWTDDQAYWLKEAQKAAMIHAAQRAGLPYTAAIDSGNKSIHFIFRISNPDIESYRNPRGENHHIYKYLEMLLVFVFGDYDNGVFKQAGYKLTRAPNAIRDNGATQNIIDVQNRQVSIQELITFGEAQLDPEVITWMRTTANFSYKQAKKSPYCLIYDEYFKDLVLGSDYYTGMVPELCMRGKGERGTAWYHISKKLVLAGQRPVFSEMPQSTHPLAEYNASFLWYQTAWLFNALCNPPLWHDPDMLRWDKDGAADFRADPQTYGMPLGTSQQDLQISQLMQANIAGADPEEVQKGLDKILKDEKKRHKEVVKTHPTFRSNVAGIGASIGAAFGGNSGGDDFNYGMEATATLDLIQAAGINLKYVVDNDEARRESWWKYCDLKHVWEPLHKLVADKLVMDLRPDLSHMSPYKLNQLIAIIRGRLLYNLDWTEGQFMLIFRNGTLRFTQNPNPMNIGEVAVFYADQFTPEDHAQIFLDYNFDATILNDINYNWSDKVPMFSEFTQGLFEVSADDTRIVQEFLGQGLWPVRQHQKVLIIRGSGGDGKGVLMSILKTIMGGRVPHSDFRPGYNTKVIRGHAETFALDKLAEKHAGSMFVGQRLLIDEEIKVLTKVEDIKNVTSFIKKLSGDGETMREDKGKQISKEKTEMRMILCCNNEPQFIDTNKGIWRRLVIVKCRPVPSGRVEIDRYHEHFLTQEMLPHLFNYLLTGLYMYQRNVAEGKPGLTMAPVHKKRVQELRNDADIISGFFDMYMELAPMCIANESITKRYKDAPISLDLLLTMINQYAFESNEKYTVKRKDLENALEDNADMAGADRLYEFRRTEAAMTAGTIGIPARTSRIKVLYGYKCLYPDMREMAGNMHHAWTRTQTKDANKPANTSSSFQGGL